jgi:hypothetical protein
LKIDDEKLLKEEIESLKMQRDLKEEQLKEKVDEISRMKSDAKKEIT